MNKRKMSMYQKYGNIPQKALEDMLDLNNESDGNDYGGLGRRIYRSLKMVEHMRKSPDPGSILGFDEAMAPARFEV